MHKRASQSSEENLDHLTTLFRLLSDRTRLHILLLLSDGERNVSSLCQALKAPQPTVSHHLGLLRSSRIIHNRRCGKQIYYALNDHCAGESHGLDIIADGVCLRVMANQDQAGT